MWEIGLVAMASVWSGCAGRALMPLPPKANDRVVCLGDSITDGCTYPQILIQALKEAGKPVPAIICAGVASDTAPQMAARLERTVLAFKPSLVTFSAGTNDSLRGLSPAQYEKSLREISAKVKAVGATMLLLTPCIISPARKADEAARGKAEDAEKTIAQYVEVIRKVAREEGYPVAQNNALMQAARREGKELMSPDGIHPNYLGQSLMARSILDAMGCRNVPLPTEFRPQLFPGVVREWRMRLAPLDGKKPQRLTAATARALQPDETWKTYTLPDPVPPEKPTAEDWWEQERRNGFGLKVHERAPGAGDGSGKGLVQAVAFLDAPRARKAYVNTGVGVSTVWLNGEKLHEQGSAGAPRVPRAGERSGEWSGFHAGKERLPAGLKAGRNVLAIEIDGPQFFLSVTDKLCWEADLGR